MGKTYKPVQVGYIFLYNSNQTKTDNNEIKTLPAFAGGPHISLSFKPNKDKPRKIQVLRVKLTSLCRWATNLSLIWTLFPVRKNIFTPIGWWDFELLICGNILQYYLGGISFTR